MCDLKQQTFLSHGLRGNSLKSVTLSQNHSLGRAVLSPKALGENMLLASSGSLDGASIPWIVTVPLDF